MTEWDQCKKVIANRIYGTEASCNVEALGTFFAEPENAVMEKAVQSCHKHCNRQIKQRGIMQQELWNIILLQQQLPISNNFL